jgi:hypothetical protein
MHFRAEENLFCSVRFNILVFTAASLWDLTAVIAILLKDGKALSPRMNEQISEH